MLGVLGPYGRLPQYLAEAAIDHGAVLTQVAVEDDRWERWQEGPGPRLWGAVVMMDYLLTAADPKSGTSPAVTRSFGWPVMTRRRGLAIVRGPVELRRRCAVEWPMPTAPLGG